MTKRKNGTRKSRMHTRNIYRPAINRKYKDTVFRMVFSDKKNLLSLYNAISRRNYQDVSMLEIVTLENAIYLGMKNDLAFLIDTNIFLFEHQSTANPNMPLRDLFYISHEYQSLVDQKSLYSSALQKIPAPNFIVFYNGTARKEERWVNRLSDAFENLVGEPNLELLVITLNINEGYNRELVEQCKILKEYMMYVNRVRKYAESMPLDIAINQAVDDCIQDGVLEKFLRKNRAEVIEMSIFEYNQEEEERKLRKAEYEAGMEAGMEKQLQRIVRKKYQKGCTKEEIAEALEEDVQVIEKVLADMTQSSSR